MFVIRIKIAKYDISVFFVLTFLNYSNYSTRSLDERARSRLYVLENVDLDVLTRNNKGVSDRRLFPH